MFQAINNDFLRKIAKILYSMNEQNKKMQILETMPIPKVFLVLGWPTMAGMLINERYNLSDTYFMNGLGTALMVGALVNVLLDTVFIYGLGMRVAGAAKEYGGLAEQRDRFDAENQLLIIS